MSDVARRQFQRFPCGIKAALHAPASNALIGECTLTDVSPGGGLIETSKPLERGVPYELRFSWQKHRLHLPARLAWEAKSGPKSKVYRFGLSFTLTSRQEDLLRRMIDEIRLHLWSGNPP